MQGPGQADVKGPTPESQKFSEGLGQGRAHLSRHRDMAYLEVAFCPGLEGPGGVSLLEDSIGQKPEVRQLE